MNRTELEKILGEIENQEKIISQEKTKLYSIKSKINEPVKQIAERWFEIIKKYDGVLDRVSRYSFIDSQYYNFESCRIDIECGWIYITYEANHEGDVDEWFSLPLTSITNTEKYFKDLEETGIKNEKNSKNKELKNYRRKLI